MSVEPAYEIIKAECERALSADIADGHKWFSDMYQKHKAWLTRQAFFWLAWIELHERHYSFRMAVTLYNQSIVHRAEVFNPSLLLSYFC